MSDTLVKPETQPSRTGTNNGDHDAFAHYVKKNAILPASVGGNALMALCGKIFVPKRDPLKLQVCPECKEIYDGLPAGPSS